jgi:GT2 family glycosyltransferase
MPESQQQSRSNLPVDVSIIYVNWNSVAYVRESIASIYEQTRNIRFEIVVVDNASPAGGVDVLKQEFPDIVLIKSSQNLGFAGANNLGYKNSSGKNLLFLNPDTKLVSPAINLMLKRMEALPNAGILGCKLLNSDLSVQTSCIQRFPTILNQVLDADYLRFRWPNSPLYGIAPLFSSSIDPAAVEVISGACMLVKRDVFERAGLFSEEYFMYAEDLDLCYKVVSAGFVNYYSGDATVIHYGGKSSVPKSATVMKWKAIVRFCVKTRGYFYGLLFRFAMILAALVRLSIIGVLSVFGKSASGKKGQYSAAEKWKAILKTLLRESGSNVEMANGRSRVSGPSVSQV